MAYISRTRDKNHSDNGNSALETVSLQLVPDYLLISDHYERNSFQTEKTQKYLFFI